MEEKSGFIQCFECPQCFLIWEEHLLKREDINDFFVVEKKCGYCETHRRMSSLQLLRRRLKTAENSRISRFPELIQHLVKHINLTTKAIETNIEIE